MSLKKFGDDTDKDSIWTQAALLGEMLAQSAEYRQYQEAKSKLQGDFDQSYILSLLRQQQIGMFLAQILGLALDDTEDDLENLYALFSQEPLVCDFLYAEGRLRRLISEVQQVCGDKLELWSEIDATSRMQYRELN